jgi:hypothetical protein
MGDIFKLFDGRIGAGGAASISDQHAESFSDVTPENELVARLASGSDSVELKVDYSDFSNFVTFNSAYSYVNVTADKILNDYPIGGTVDDLQVFLQDLDGYQRYFLKNWPSRTGHLRLNPANGFQYVRFDDFGVQDGVSRTSFMSPGTGSFSVQGWLDVSAMTGSEDAQVVFQKLKSNGDGYAVFVSGSSVHFQVVSGALSSLVSAPFTSMPMFFAAVCDRSATTGTLSLYSATTASFPVLSQATSVLLGSRYDLASSSFHIGSGSITSKVTRPFTGSLDDVSVWSTARTLAALTSSYNRKIYAQPNLIAAWRFNEASQTTPVSVASIVRDVSGHRLDGRIQAYHSSSRGSGSLAYDSPDPIMSLDDPTVVSYVVTAQQSGTLYDRSNQSLIFNLFPEAFSTRNPTSAEVFHNFALIIARHFDRIKLYVDQLANMRRVDYGEFDQAPDELLEDVAGFFGWDLKGTFVNADALKYFIGRDVTAGPQGNAGLDTRLSDIKAQFWRRFLQNMAYIYKTKGTRESVEAVLRAYGVNNGFVRLKEYARKSQAKLPVNRVESEKSVYTLRVSGSNSVSFSMPRATGGTETFLVVAPQQFSTELRVKFPGPLNDDMAPTSLSGSIFTISSGSDAACRVALWYEKESASSLTGNLFLTSSAGRLQLVSASLFDDNFYNLSVVKENSTGSITLSAYRYDSGQRVYVTSSVSFSGSTGYPFNSNYQRVELGNSVLTPSLGQFWAHEFRLWSAALLPEELDAHAAHFESYGRENSYDNEQLLIHWRLNDGVSSDAGTLAVVDSTLAGRNGTGSFPAASNPFDKFLEPYSYIPSIDYGWNQEKVRVYDGPYIDPQERYIDERIVSLEFNMYDALNEDISHLMSSYDELNGILGLPVNRYREDYEGLQQMRETYFKRLQGKLNFRVFADMLDFFDTSFVSIIERLLPARVLFKGDELVVESHMLERPKFQYNLRPIREGIVDISGSIAMVDRDWDYYD